LKVLVIQFIKGGWVYGELLAAGKLEGLEMRPLGEGFVRDAGEEKAASHRAAARKALEEAREEITAGKWDMIILDEIIYAVGFKLLQVEDLFGLIDVKPPEMHLVMTGRNAPEALVDRADLVTEMKEIKHPFSRGIKAQKGVEY
jgi:cob(I)alamin adenosyltransferase